MKKKILALAMCLALVFTLCSCGGGGDAGSADSSGSSGSNTVVVAMGGGFDTLDPGYVYEKYPPVVVNACYENLFKFYSNDGEAEPCLADTYEFSEDGLTLTVKLKDNVTFASGNKMTSADVVFSINRTKNLKGNPSFICDTIESMETPDDLTVVFHLTQPDSAILSKLTYPAMCVLDSAVVKENGGTDAENASTADTAQAYLDTTSAGSGMYVMTSYTPDQEIVLEKNENYWGEGTNVDKYIIRIQSDANTQMMTLSSGDLDIALNLTDDTMAELEGNENIETINAATKTVGFVMMNMDESIGGPVSNPQVQEAIRKAIDYEGLKEICGEGTITPYSLIQAGFMGSKGEKAEGYTDIEEAKSLLAEAGYPDGFDIDMQVCDLDLEGVLLTDLAQKIKEDLSQIGINVNIVTEAWAAGYGDDYRDGKLGFTVMYWSVDYNDPNVQLAFLPGQSVGLRAGWTAEMDPEIAAYNDSIMRATNTDDRVALLGELQDDLADYGPFIMIAQAPCHMAYNTRLEGVTNSDPYSLDLTLINIK